MVWKNRGVDEVEAIVSGELSIRFSTATTTKAMDSETLGGLGTKKRGSNETLSFSSADW